MNKQELKRQLKNHDWYHDYSDDSRVWRRGWDDKKRLESELSKLGCPFAWWHIFMALHGCILEEHIEVEPGKFRKPDWGTYTASRSRRELLTKVEVDTILQWFEE